MQKMLLCRQEILADRLNRGHMTNDQIIKRGLTYEFIIVLVMSHIKCLKFLKICLKNLFSSHRNYSMIEIQTFFRHHHRATRDILLYYLP